MSNAVYILSSLPMLQFGDVPPLSLAEFRSRCGSVLSEEELQALDALLSGEESDNPYVQAYQSRDNQMKNVSGKLRAQAWGPDVRFTEKPYVGYDVTFAKMVADAFNKADPLEKEQDIDKARFWLADSLASVDDATMGSVFSYAIKLQICERWARLNNEAGDAAVINVINANDPAFGQV